LPAATNDAPEPGRESQPRSGQGLQRFAPTIERLREVLSFAARRASEVRVQQVASSLTLTTVLSIVPLLAVALSVFSAFPLFAEYRSALEKMLLRELLPPPISATILRYLSDFSAKAAGLTAYGLIFLCATALLMIHTVDRALNDIWNVRVRRALLPRILIYWALMTLGPLVLGASLSATSVLLSNLAAGRTTPFALQLLLDYGPFLLGGFAFALLYVVVPNRRVRWVDALIGGFTASLLGEFITAGFTAYIKTGTVAGIYGAFAVVPLFLLWVYLSWVALLFGAAVAATLPMLRATRFADERRAGNRFVTAVALLGALYGARQRDEDGGRVTLERLARDLRTFPEETERLLGELERLGYVAKLDGVHAGKWLLSCDPQRTDLGAAFRRLAVDPANTLLTREMPALALWMRSGLESPWVSAPLAQVFASPDIRASRSN
jgi:membrane protein